MIVQKPLLVDVLLTSRQRRGSFFAGVRRCVLLGARLLIFFLMRLTLFEVTSKERYVILHMVEISVRLNSPLISQSSRLFLGIDTAVSGEKIKLGQHWKQRGSPSIAIFPTLLSFLVFYNVPVHSVKKLVTKKLYPFPLLWSWWCDTKWGKKL